MSIIHKYYQEIKDGSLKACHSFYTKTISLVREECIRYFDDEMIINKITHRSYTLFFRKIAQYEGKDIVRCLLDITSQLCTHHIKNRIPEDGKIMMVSMEQMKSAHFETGYYLDDYGPFLRLMDDATILQQYRAITHSLTVSEKACIFLWAQGIDMKTIAKQFEISENAVRRFLCQAMDKIIKDTLEISDQHFGRMSEKGVISLFLQLQNRNSEWMKKNLPNKNQLGSFEKIMGYTTINENQAKEKPKKKRFWPFG